MFESCMARQVQKSTGKKFSVLFLIYIWHVQIGLLSKLFPDYLSFPNESVGQLIKRIGATAMHYYIFVAFPCQAAARKQ